MNNVSKQALAALVLAGVMAAPAAASVPRDVQQAISGGNIIVTVDDAGVATLSGYTNGISRVAAQRAAQNSDEVNRVINLIERS